MRDYFMATINPGLNQYRCAQCKGIFDKGWSDEDALEEKNRHFPGTPVEDCVIVCDDCYLGVRKSSLMNLLSKLP